MLITNLKIENFRNYRKLNLNFNKDINVFFGDNAQGKTNIVEAVYLCSIGKSFRAHKDKELINFNSDFAKVELDFKKIDRSGNIKIEISDKKNVYINGIKIKKLSELIGRINVVIFTPDDINILKNGPKMRRRFLDILISQLRPNYISNLNLYLKTLEQRNAYLKQIKFENKDKKMLEIWDEKLFEYGKNIFKYRKEFIEKIQVEIKKIHGNITEKNEKIAIVYKSDFEDNNFLTKLNQNKNFDIARGNTSCGVHRDDFLIYINDINVNTYGSQGQNRTAVLSLKMAELQVIKNEIGENPILLLDDFMSELDEKRRTNFLKNIKDTQVIITCTDKFDVENLNYYMYNVKNGNVIL